MIYSRILLVIHIKHCGVHTSTPDSLAIPLLHPSLLATIRSYQSYYFLYAPQRVDTEHPLGSALPSTGTPCQLVTSKRRDHCLVPGSAVLRLPPVTRSSRPARWGISQPLAAALAVWILGKPACQCWRHGMEMGIWDARCLLEINACEKKGEGTRFSKREKTNGDASQTKLQPIWRRVLGL